MSCCSNPKLVPHPDPVCGNLVCQNCDTVHPASDNIATDRAERVAALIRARFGTTFGVLADGDRVSFDLVSLRRLIEALIATQSEGRDFERALAVAIKGTSS